ncbi:hypothetical protein [Marinicella meishanensis]|uniref:hypothetical protein n=1 Tax=Marinicella meishanensis TaxID=2873263 RepID=UPI001CC0E962|nr:hypothetical protein [Marinicella sp. NBU2979]
MSNAASAITEVDQITKLFELLNNNPLLLLFAYAALMYLFVNLLRVIIKDVFEFAKGNNTEELITQCNRTLGGCQEVMKIVLDKFENNTSKKKKKKKK